MKCENCGKNEVSFVYRSSINGKTEEHHLCQACAEKLGYTQKLFARRPSMVDSFFGSDDFFSDFFSPMPSLLGRMNRMLEFGVTTVEGKSGYGMDRNTELKQLRAMKELDASHPVDIVTTFLGPHSVLPQYKGKEREFIDML